MLIRLRSSCSSSSSSWAGSWTSPASLHVGGAAQPASCTADWNDRPGAVTASPSAAAQHAKTTPGAHRLYRLAPTLSCVLATAQDANMAEYEVWVPSDCVASRQPQRKREALSLLSRSLNARTVASSRVRGL